ncbi:hypothetical protein D3C71_1598020 [compost metagenome]
MQGLVPHQHVVQSRIQSPGAEDDADVGDRLGRQSGGEVGVAHGQALGVGVGVRPGVFQAQGFQDGVVQIGLERLAAGLGDDLGGQIIGGVVVSNLGARLEL